MTERCDRVASECHSITTSLGDRMVTSVASVHFTGLSHTKHCVYPCTETVKSYSAMPQEQNVGQYIDRLLLLPRSKQRRGLLG